MITRLKAGRFRVRVWARHLVVMGRVRVEARDCIVSVNILTKIDVQ